AVAMVTVVTVVFEIEHLGDRAGDAVKAPLADALAAEPVVLHEAQHRGHIGRSVVDKVLLGKRRYHEKRLSRAITAAAQSVGIRRIDARQSRGRISAGARSSEEVVRPGR